MRSRRRKRARKAQSVAVLAVVLIVALAFILIKIGVGAFQDGYKKEIVSDNSFIPEIKTDVGSPLSTPVSSDVEVVYGDPDNYIYPYNTMSADWGNEVYDEGFRYYEIPKEYAREGGCFPEVVQVYLWSLCKERGIDYYTVIALIERESGYKWDATGDSGASKGYMQIGEKWYKDLMVEEGVDDLYNPYGNIRVGLSILRDISDSYLESSGMDCVLMVYNMGNNGAKKCWAEGIYSTSYTRGILARAAEIKQEIEQE